MATYRYMIVDVFTDTPLAGNQLGVFSNAIGMSDELMQRLASELGFSETTFVLPPAAGGDVKIRIFTPTREIPFAGHPTLGTAFALGSAMQAIVLRIETGMGIVPVALQREGAKIVYGRMEQPVPTIESFGSATEELLEALGVSASVLPVDIYDNGLCHVFVTLPTFAEVAALKPDLGWIDALLGSTEVNVCAVEGGKAKTRNFGPGNGVNEDAATGSAAGPLAVHLSRHGVLPWGEEIEISQGAEIGRPSTLYAAAYGSDAEVTAVDVGGRAVVVARGEFHV